MSADNSVNDNFFDIHGDDKFIRPQSNIALETQTSQDTLNTDIKHDRNENFLSFDDNDHKNPDDYIPKERLASVNLKFSNISETFYFISNDEKEIVPEYHFPNEQALSDTTQSIEHDQINLTQNLKYINLAENDPPNVTTSSSSRLRSVLLTPDDLAVIDDFGLDSSTEIEDFDEEDEDILVNALVSSAEKDIILPTDHSSSSLRVGPLEYSHIDIDNEDDEENTNGRISSSAFDVSQVMDSLLPSSLIQKTLKNTSSTIDSNDGRSSSSQALSVAESFRKVMRIPLSERIRDDSSLHESSDLEYLRNRAASRTGNSNVYFCGCPVQ